MVFRLGIHGAACCFLSYSLRALDLATMMNDRGRTLVIPRTRYPTLFVAKEMGCEDRFTGARRINCANLKDPRPASRKRSSPSSQDLEKRLSRQIGKRRGNGSNQSCWAPPLPSSRNPMTSSQGKGPSWIPAGVPQQCVLTTLLPALKWGL